MTTFALVCRSPEESKALIPLYRALQNADFIVDTNDVATVLPLVEEKIPFELIELAENKSYDVVYESTYSFSEKALVSVGFCVDEGNWHSLYRSLPEIAKFHLFLDSDLKRREQQGLKRGLVDLSLLESSDFVEAILKKSEGKSLKHVVFKNKDIVLSDDKVALMVEQEEELNRLILLANALYRIHYVLPNLPNERYLAFVDEIDQKIGKIHKDEALFRTTAENMGNILYSFLEPIEEKWLCTDLLSDPQAKAVYEEAFFVLEKMGSNNIFTLLSALKKN
jgi:hypothetical protein